MDGRQNWAETKQRLELRWPQLKAYDLDALEGDRNGLLALFERDLGYARANAERDLDMVLSGREMTPEVADDTHHTGSSSPLDAHGEPVHPPSAGASHSADDGVRSNAALGADGNGHTSEAPFAGYPKHYLLAIIDDHASATNAVATMRQQGITNVELLEGRQGTEVLDSDGSQHGVLASLLRGTQKLSSEMDHLREYDTAVQEGYSVLAVYAEDQQLREQAKQILERHDARFVNYFGGLAVELLVR